MQIPITTIILASFHRSLPKELDEAAAMDGASPSRIFVRIMMPLTGPALVACGVINVLQIWNEFLYALTLLQDTEMYALSVGIFNLSQLADYSSNWAVLFAGMVIAIVPIIVAFGFFQRGFARGIAEGTGKL